MRVIKMIYKNSKIKNINKKANDQYTKQTNRKKSLLSDNNDKPVHIKYKLNKKKILKCVLLIILSSIFVYSITSLALNQIDYYRNKKDSKKLIDEVIFPNESIDNLSEAKEEDELKEERSAINPENLSVDFNKLKKKIAIKIKYIY